MAESLFHIMVPVYKVEQYLDQCVQSVLNQTYQNFRLYLIDDGSPDRSGEICDRWAAKDERIRVWHKPNGGLMHARRFAIARVHEGALSENDYGIFLDSDDWLLPHALETIARAIRTHNSDCVIYGAERVLEGKVMMTLSTLPEAERVVTDKAELCRIVMQDPLGSYYAIWRKAVRMDRLSPDMELYAPYYHISMGEDTLQSLEIYRNCERFCFVKEILHQYRLNPASMTQTVRYENYKVDYTVYEKEAKFLRDGRIFNETDFRAYRSFRLHSFTGELVRIAALDTPRENRMELYERIKQTDYWKHFLSDPDYDRRELGKMVVLCEAFRRGKYGRIFLLTKLYQMLGKL